MNSQILRIVLAGLLSFTSLVAVCILSLVGAAVPEIMQVTLIGATAYLFGVTTNGSGIPKSSSNDTPPK